MPKSGHTGRSLLSALLLKGIAIPILLSPIAIADEGAFGSEEMATRAEMAVGSPVTVADSAIADSDVSIDIDEDADGNFDGVEDDVASEGVLTSESVAPEEGFVERAARAFTESDLVFARGFSNAPFLPVAFLGNTHYGDATVSEEGATPQTAGTRYRVNSTSQYGGIPFLLSKRSMAVLGEYVS